MSNLRLILNEELPEDLRNALDNDAKAKDITLNDAAVSALSVHFQEDPKLSGFHYRPVAEKFKLRVPEDLHKAIRLQAAHRLQTVRGVALSELAAYYGTTPIDAARRPRGKAEV